MQRRRMQMELHDGLLRPGLHTLDEHEPVTFRQHADRFAPPRLQHGGRIEARAGLSPCEKRREPRLGRGTDHHDASARPQEAERLADR